MLKHRTPSAALRVRERGFTLIELMVVLAIIGVSASLAAPSFSKAIANYRVRAGAESIINGLNFARSEAVRRNASVSFTMNTADSGWTVALVSSGTTLQSRSKNDSAGVAVALSPASATAVTFLATGLVQTSTTRLARVVASSTTADTDSRQVDIFGGGLIRMCDPSVSTANDPRRC